MELEAMYEGLGITPAVQKFCTEIEAQLKERFEAIDETAEYNQMKVLKAMQEARVSDIHFAATTGYGYNDLGRDVLEEVYAKAFHGESALVRPQLISGTHALHVALSGNLRPGDELLSPVGKPYDTLEEVIGIRDSVGSLKEYGVVYRQVDLLEDGSFVLKISEKQSNEKTKLVTSSVLRLCHPSYFVCRKNRPADFFCKECEAGCYLYGGQLLRRICRTDRAH